MKIKYATSLNTAEAFKQVEKEVLEAPEWLKHIFARNDALEAMYRKQAEADIRVEGMYEIKATDGITISTYYDEPFTVSKEDLQKVQEGLAGFSAGCAGCVMCGAVPGSEACGTCGIATRIKKPRP